MYNLIEHIPQTLLPRGESYMFVSDTK